MSYAERRLGSLAGLGAPGCPGDIPPGFPQAPGAAYAGCDPRCDPGMWGSAPDVVKKLFGDQCSQAGIDLVHKCGGDTNPFKRLCGSDRASSSGEGSSSSSSSGFSLPTIDGLPSWALPAAAALLLVVVLTK